MLHFDVLWYALGPFSIGTREDPWRDSVDFQNLSPSNDLFPSGLCCGAQWKELEMDLIDLDDFSTLVSIDLDYPDVQWSDLINTYGWAATQFDAWIRGTLHVVEDCIVRLNVRNSPEFMLDGVRYEGDIYDLQIPIILPLTKGSHRLDVRAVREIRIFGFQEQPIATVVIAVSCIHESGQLDVRQRHIPDCVIAPNSRRAASSYASIQVDNVTASPVSLTTIGCSGMKLLIPLPIEVAPYQSRVIILDMANHVATTEISIVYVSGGRKQQAECTIAAGPEIQLGSPHLITYLNPDMSLGRAILRPPKLPSTAKSAPIVLALHGAGVDINHPAWKEVFASEFGEAWIVQPDCGKWGDDWHSYSALSIDACLASINDWVHKHGWLGPMADIQKIMIMGHSNGAQGALQFMVRNSDRIIGSAFAAGYLSIASYVPYSLWTTNARYLADRAESDVVRNLEMIHGIRCFVRHGVCDDNVPIYHSRLLKSLVPAVILEEMPSQGHWYDGILTTGRIKDFVQQCLKEEKVARPRDFSVISWGRPIQRGGLIITEVDDMNSLPARLHVRFSEGRETSTSHGVKEWSHLPQDHSVKCMEQRDASCILESAGPIDIEADLDIALRIAHSLLLYHGIDSNINCNGKRYGNVIAARIDHTMTKTAMRLSTTSHQGRLTMTLAAYDEYHLSKLIRLLPWRTGVGHPGQLLVDLSVKPDIVVEHNTVSISRVYGQLSAS